MKRYLLFGGYQYYPAGGWQDFRGSFPSIHAAVEKAARREWEWWHIVDTHSQEIVKEHVRA